MSLWLLSTLQQDSLSLTQPADCVRAWIYAWVQTQHPETEQRRVFSGCERFDQHCETSHIEKLEVKVRRRSGRQEIMVTPQRALRGNNKRLHGFLQWFLPVNKTRICMNQRIRSMNPVTDEIPFPDYSLQYPIQEELSRAYLKELQVNGSYNVLECEIQTKRLSASASYEITVRTPSLLLPRPLNRAPISSCGPSWSLRLDPESDGGLTKGTPTYVFVALPCSPLRRRHFT